MIKIEKTLYLKYGELCLKGKNRKEFTKTLNQNLKFALNEYKNLEYEFYYDYVLVKNLNDNQIDELINIIKFIPGFYYVSLTFKIERNIEALKDLLNDIVSKNINQKLFTFKIETHRSDKKYEINSDQLKRLVANDLLINFSNLKVDLFSPDFKIFIDVKKDSFLVYSNKIKCENGLPVSSSGRVLLLLSGGIDSPVAAKLLLSRGFNVDFITFITPPYTNDKVVQKIKDLIKVITLDYKISKNINLYICNFTNIQNELTHISKQNYRINLLRRSFFRISKLIAQKYNYNAIATGESLGQVASQTIESMYCINEVMSDFLVLRPLVTFNKEEIIQLSKKYNLYDLSILPYSDSCSLFAPENPITKPKIEIVKALENEVSLLNELEMNTIKKIEIINYSIDNKK